MTIKLASKSEQSSLIKIATLLKECFDELEKPLSPTDYESFSRFLNTCYGTRNRAFHDIGHTLDVGFACSALGKLAALFHDVVYKQVDHSRFSELRELFGVFDPGESLELIIPPEEVLEQEPWRKALVLIFGFQVGQKLTPFSGMNEFLSAWVAIQKLKDRLGTKEILHIVACIEATIPFRGDLEVPSAPERLAHNIEVAESSLSIFLLYDEIDSIVTESVRVSNNDIKGFGRETPEVFIHNSWAYSTKEIQLYRTHFIRSLSIVNR